MLKKYLLIVTLSCAPLLSMELNNVTTQELKDELTKYKIVVATLAKKTPESIRASLPRSKRELESVVQEAVERHESKLEDLRGFISQYEAELAKRVDR